VSHTVVIDRSKYPTEAYRLPDLPTMAPKQLIDRDVIRANVPCGSCTLCCKTLIVPLANEEYEKYDWAWITTRDGQRLGRALQRRADGSCVYLTERGCGIHGRAPHVCQRFDCRELFLKSDRNGRRRAIKSGKLPKSLFDRGREMLKFEREFNE
jgi:hypothetical protein